MKCNGLHAHGNHTGDRAVRAIHVTAGTHAKIWTLLIEIKVPSQNKRASLAENGKPEYWHTELETPRPN